MKQPGAVLLVSCYELGHQPIGIASPLGFLERAGYAPDAIDISVERLDYQKVVRAQFVGICVPMHTALRLGVRVAERIREINPKCHICFYGLYASLNADYLFKHHADSVIGGEYETTLVALLDSLIEGRVNVEGVSRRNETAAPVLKRIPFAVPTRRTLPPLEKYARLEESGSYRIAGYVEASRGCKHLCLHCPIPPIYKGRFFVVPREVVLEDIRNQVRAGATHITFGDPDFLNGPTHSLRIVRAMHEAFPHVTFDCTVKIEHILKQRSIVPEFRDCGCTFMVSAVESLSDTVLANLDKGHTRADVFAALAILRTAGIALRPSLIPFTPWATLEDYIDLLDFVEKEALIDHVDSVQYAIRLLIPPGSSLLSYSSIQPYLGSLDEASLTYHWAHPDPRMDELHKAVSVVVERAAQIDEDAFVTFSRIRHLAGAISGKLQPSGSPSLKPPSNRTRPPRLTEDWFC